MSVLTDNIIDFLSKNLSERRFIHSLGVRDCAVSLAGKYSQDSIKAETAALLHDCCKEIPPEVLLKKAKEYDIPMNEVFQLQPGLLHGFVGAFEASTRFSIYDEDVLNAVRYHSTARPGMSMLEKIVYVADCIEPNRKKHSWMSALKSLAYSNIDEAVVFGINVSLSHLVEQNKLINPLSIDARNFFLKSLYVRK